MRRLPILLLAIALAACATVDISSFKLIGAPEFPPSDPALVQIFEHPPMRPFVRLGRIRAQPEGGADNAKIEAALRQAAAKMGADGVIIGFQGERRVGAEINGFRGDAEIQPEIGRVVQATAIRFREE
jgi:hypothetical protein